MPKISEDDFKRLKGTIHIKAWERNGAIENLSYEKTFDNLIVTAGKLSILKYLGGPNIACCSDSGYADDIGVGDSSTCPAAAQTDLQGSCKTWKQISATDKVYSCCTLFVSVDFGYCCANYTWNELGLRDSNNNMWSRQVDCTPLVKNSSKRAIVEWQLSM